MELCRFWTDQRVLHVVLQDKQNSLTEFGEQNYVSLIQLQLHSHAYFHKHHPYDALLRYIPLRASKRSQGCKSGCAVNTVHCAMKDIVADIDMKQNTL